MAVPRFDREKIDPACEDEAKDPLPEVPGVEDPLPEVPDQHESSEPQQEAGELEEMEDDEREDVSDEDVAKMNEAWRAKAKDLSETVGLQHLTLVEISESRHTRDVTPAVGKLYARFRALGVPIYRLHSDRERCFITKLFHNFCGDRSLYQTMTSGDSPQENGRIEAELAQIKRCLRLTLKESNLPQLNWPSVARWVGEQRVRQQLQSSGAPTKPLLMPGTKVMVKQKAWNKPRGPLALPYKQMTILGPSPTMSSGYVLKDGNHIQHARAVVVPAAEGEQATLELQEAPRKRLVGKQAVDPDQPRLPPPLQHDDSRLGGESQSADSRLGGDDQHPGLEGDQPLDLGEPPVPDFIYSPESPLPDEHEALSSLDLPYMR